MSFFNWVKTEEINVFDLRSYLLEEKIWQRIIQDAKTEISE